MLQVVKSSHVEILRQSLWITYAWEWLQQFLARSADIVLWITMVFSCYCLIPGAPLPTNGVRVFMFVAQFVALDVGGLGLKALCREHNLGRESFSYAVAVSLIGVTLVTVGYSGMEHALSLPPMITNIVEVILVFFRSILTVFYAQAIHSLKEVSRAEKQRISELVLSVTVLSERISELERERNRLIEENKSTIASLESTIIDLQYSQSDYKRKLQDIENSTQGSTQDLLALCTKYIQNKRSITKKEVINLTNLSIRDINKAIEEKKLRLSTRNQDRILVSSFKLWLEEMSA